MDLSEESALPQLDFIWVCLSVEPFCLRSGLKLKSFVELLCVFSNVEGQGCSQSFRNTEVMNPPSAHFTTLRGF